MAFFTNSESLRSAESILEAFNPTTTINFSIINEGTVKLNVYNTSGEIVSELINNKYSAGNHTINFDGSDLSAGVYYYILEANDQVLSNKMILLK